MLASGDGLCNGTSAHCSPGQKKDRDRVSFSSVGLREGFLGLIVTRIPYHQLCGIVLSILAL